MTKEENAYAVALNLFGCDPETPEEREIMETFFKAVRPDGTDFHTGTVDYASLSGTGQQLPELPGGPCCTGGVYHASTVAAETLIGGSWPCRLFEVEGEPVSSNGSKRGFTTLRVLGELPAWQALGPNGQAIAALIERVGRITPDEAVRMSAARDAAWDATWDAARFAARFAAWDAAGSAARFAAGSAAGDAALALVARDLITPEQFDVLYGPWASVFGPAEGANPS